jgi:hypothetical protein
MAAPSGPEPEPRFSLRLSLDLKGHQKLSSWQWLVALVCALVSPLLWRLTGKWLMGAG